MRLRLLLFVAAWAAAAGSASAATSGNTSIDNGRAIFLTGRDAQGVQIVASPPAGRASCAACHRSTGAGGVHVAPGVVSADLRHKAMTTDQVAQKLPPYTVALIERAVSRGIDNAGKPLDKVMPHWKLSARDLHDVANYVYTQLK